jgi:putative transcriptional regulator
VRQWEISDKHPSGPSLKLLNLLDKKGLQVLI